MPRVKKPKFKCSTDNFVHLTKWTKEAGFYNELSNEERDFYSGEAVKLNTARGRNTFDDPTPREALRIAKAMTGVFGGEYAVMVRRGICKRVEG